LSGGGSLESESSVGLTEEKKEGHPKKLKKFSGVIGYGNTAVSGV